MAQFSLPKIHDPWSRRKIAIQAPERRCRRCGVTKPLIEFNRFNTRDGVKYFGPCKSCKKVHDAARYWADPEAKRAYAKAHRAAGFDYRKRRRRKVVDAFGGKCNACGTTTGRLCIDHDHKTGVVRGVLCHDCNIALGHLRDNPARIDALAQYARARCGRRVVVALPDRGDVGGLAPSHGRSPS